MTTERTANATAASFDNSPAVRSAPSVSFDFSEFKMPAANQRSSSASGTPGDFTPGDFNSLLYPSPSPFDAPLDCFNLDPNTFAADLAFAAAMTPHIQSLLAPSPMNAAIHSPFMGSVDPSYTGSSSSLFDDFSMDVGTDGGLGGDFNLFDDAPAASFNTSASAPAAQQGNTPLIPVNGTPLIPLQNTPFLPVVPMFPEQAKVSISMEDLTQLLAIANGNNANLGAQNLALLQKQLAAVAGAGAGPGNAASAAGPSRAQIDAHRDRVRRRASKLYTCTFEGCGKQFTRAFNLKTHEGTHDSDRPRDFICEEPGCGKTFVRIHDLARHAVAHDQSKWHFCGGCNRGFARIDALRRHERSSTGTCRGSAVEVEALEHSFV
ncbi:hypothetical protein BDR26DRAFT_871321 [Obelidium mucronatum]|nr:hypothetical protein BDR26DRAFT_871321 [Obelidium mucronatum]